MPSNPSPRLTVRAVKLCAALVALLAFAAGCSGGSRCPTCPRHTEPAQATIPR